jgi:hypothetical protein
MDTFNVIADVASICSLLASIMAAFLAARASKAVAAALDAACVHSLADELHIACTRAERLLDLLQAGRVGEASRRVDDLAFSLSELHPRRRCFLPQRSQNTIRTVQWRIQTVSEAILRSKKEKHDLDIVEITLATRMAIMGLREVLGGVRSHSESIHV